MQTTGLTFDEYVDLRLRPPAGADRAVLICYWIAMYIATHWPDVDRYKPETGWWIPSFGTVMHLSIYGLWAALWWWVLRARGIRLTGVVLTWFILGTAAYAAFDELTQAIVSRTPDFPDFVADVVGASVVAAVLNFTERYLPPAPNPSGTAA